MLTRMIAVFAALAVIGFAAVVAPSPAVAQTGGDSTATTPATATPTATPAPLESFALKPHIGNLRNLRSLTRLGNKWYVGGYGPNAYADNHIHVFSDTGTYERRLRVEGGSGVGGGASVYNSGIVHGLTSRLTSDGTQKLIAATNQATVYEWTPQTNGALVPSYSAVIRLPTPPGGGEYRADGIAHDGTDTWVAVSWPNSGADRHSKHGLLKLNLLANTLYRANQRVKSLVYENGYLYSVSSGGPDLMRISPTSLSTTSASSWEVVQRSVEVRNGGLVFRNGVAYGFNAAQDKVRKARQPSAERLFALTPSIGNLNPQSLARLGNKWYVGGHSGDGYIHVFNNDGTTPPSPSPSRIKKPAAEIRGLTSDGTNLIAAAVSRAEAIAFADGSRVDVRVPHVYKWTPQTNSTASVSATPFCIPNALGYTPNGIAHDGTHIWVALDSPARNILVKLNGTTGAHIGTYRMNGPVAGLTHQNGALYGLSGGNIVIAVASHLKTSPATWVNNWEVVKRDSGLADGLAFRNGTAYGFNAAQDEVRAERGNPTIRPTAPITPPTPPTTPTSPTTTTPTTPTTPTSPAS